MEEVDIFLWIACIDVEELGRRVEQQVLQNGTPINGSPLVLVMTSFILHIKIL